MKIPSITLVSLLIGGCIVAGAIVYERVGFPWFRGELPNCIAYHSGTVRVEMNYPNDFIVIKYPDIFQVHRRSELDPSKPANESPLLNIDNSGMYQSVDEMTKDSFGDYGVKYHLTTFNGHDAAFTQYQTPSDIEYLIPMGNRTIRITYRHELLKSERERQLFDKLLRNVKFNLTGDDSQASRVEDCK
jgi:hypothetical protein